MKVSVIGAGYVGLTTSVCLAELGHHVTTVECDRWKLDQLQRGIPTIHEKLLPELLKKHLPSRLAFTHSIAAGIAQAEIVFLCVGTPSLSGGGADLAFIDAAVREIGKNLSRPLLIVEKSTVPVRTCEVIRSSFIRNGVDPELLHVASNPEFLREGNAIRDFLYPDRVVLGADDIRSRQLLRNLYRSMIDGDYYAKTDLFPRESYRRVRVIESSVKSAELIKHASNAFLATKVSFINVIANIAEEVGADIDEVRAGMGADPRIGSQFMEPGIGFGGACLPKDVAALRVIGESAGQCFDLLSEALRINSLQRQRFLDKVKRRLGPLKGKRFAVLGLAFKAGTDDIRNSPAIDIVRRLVNEGAKIVAYDPAAVPLARAHLRDARIEFGSGIYETIAGADALIILTDWPEFASLDLYRVRELLRQPTVFDGRNLYDPQRMRLAGFKYVSVGRLVQDSEPSSFTVRPAHTSSRDGVTQSDIESQASIAGVRLTAE